MKCCWTAGTCTQLTDTSEELRPKATAISDFDPFQHFPACKPEFPQRNAHGAQLEALQIFLKKHKLPCLIKYFKLGHFESK